MIAGAVGVKERPILFSAPMVRAILDGSKTQTRRVVKGDALGILNLEIRPPSDPIFVEKCLYGKPGDRLWVRETFNPDWAGHGPIYKADGGSAIEAGYSREPRWKPSIHMPRKLSRITLEITGVRVERLKDISEYDSLAEGIYQQQNPICYGPPTGKNCNQYHLTPREAYKALWESINSAES